MDKRSSVTMLKDALGFKLSRRKFESGRLGIWKNGGRYGKWKFCGHLCG